MIELKLGELLTVTPAFTSIKIRGSQNYRKSKLGQPHYSSFVVYHVKGID